MYAKIFLTTLLFIAFQGNSFAQFGGGTGTESDPWQIKTLVHLDEIRNHPGVSTAPVFFKLMNNLVFTASDDLNGSAPGNINPINTMYATLDGNGKTITGVVIESIADYAGLFSLNSGGSIKNLGLVNCSITGITNVGGIIGLMNGEISNCTVSGTVKGTNFIGGIVGTGSGNILNCSFSGSVTGIKNVGGIAGEVTLCNLFKDCNNSGTITGNNLVGGIAGSISGSSGAGLNIIQGCVNTGKVNGTSGGNYIAGVVSNYQNMTLNNCSNYGEINAPACDFVAGISNTFSTNTTLRCFNEGNIIGHNNVSGIGYGRFSGCYNTGNISGNNNVGGISCVRSIGAFVYWNSVNGSSGQYPKPVFAGCYNTGKVTGNRFVGGITPGIQGGVPTFGGCFYIQGKVESGDSRIVEVSDGAQAVTEAQLKSQVVVSAMNAALHNQDTAIFKKYFWRSTSNGYPSFNETPSSTEPFSYNVYLNILPYTVPIEINGICFNTRDADSLALFQLPAGDYAVKIADYPDATIQTFHVNAADNNILLLNTGITSIANGNNGKIFQLYSPEHLHTMRYANNSSFELHNDITFGSQHDFSLTPGNFYGIYLFSGSLNGKDYAIKNLIIQEDSLDDVGFFTNMSNYRQPGGTLIKVNPKIHNLTLENVNIKGRNYVGAIAGGTPGKKDWTGVITMDSCRVTGVVAGSENVGGCVGYCSNEMNFMNNECIVTGTKNVGGISGASFEIISNSKNKGKIIGVENVGGISGNTGSIILDSYNYEKITGNTNVGGITGFLGAIFDNSLQDSVYGVIKNCMNKSTIVANNTNAIAGGITGTISASTTHNLSATVVGSCNLGSINATSDEVRIGGIAGNSYGKIKACYNAGDINVSGSGYAGGLAGYSGNETLNFQSSRAKDSCSYNAGNIVAKYCNTGILFGCVDNRLVVAELATMFSGLYYLQDTTAVINAGIPAVGLWKLPDGPFPKIPVALTVEQLRQSWVIDSLNKMSIQMWKADTTPAFNNGFPILIWQKEGIVDDLSVPKIANKADILVYPNPTNYQLRITNRSHVSGKLSEANYEGTIKSVEIFDLSGKTLLSQMSNLSQINVSHLASGIYLIKIQTDKGTVTKKFVKE